MNQICIGKKNTVRNELFVLLFCYWKWKLGKEMIRM